MSGKTGNTQELLSRIRELELENMELKSKLDQFQSIFSLGGESGSSGSGGGGGGGSSSSGGRARRTNRGVGISAEPQMLKNIQDLKNTTFQEFKKNDK